MINDINPNEGHAEKIVTPYKNPIVKQNVVVQKPSVPILSRLGLGLGLASTPIDVPQ